MTLGSVTLGSVTLGSVTLGSVTPGSVALARRSAASARSRARATSGGGELIAISARVISARALWTASLMRCQLARTPQRRS